jgi:lipopolysaccharide/colanic/teichoic acid biosynthesis glycosyltransferase
MYLKRITDIILSVFLLIILSPLMIFLILLVKISSKGPVFYQWNVIGKDGIPFVGYKFRTMYENSDAKKKDLQSLNEMTGPVFKITKDPRITKVGRYLRKYSLDELPQLLSVVKGDMSLVGPRPPLQIEYAEFEEWQKYKVSIKPGMTCLWQVSGRNNIRVFDDWVRLDIHYIENQSFLLDIKIIIKTVLLIFKGNGK